MKSALICGLDVGSTHTRAIIGEYAHELRRPVLQVVGVGSAVTEGVRKDVITDLDAATESIHGAITEAEIVAGARVNRIHVGVAGNHISVEHSMGMVVVGGAEVGPESIRQVNEVARAVSLPQDREILHAIPQQYRLDNQRGIHDPAGMFGNRLEVELCLVTASKVLAGNLARAVERAGYSVQARVLKPLASARAVLAEDEKELGAVLVDMGGSATGVALYYEGRAIDLMVFPFGGSAITSDLIRELSVPFAVARRIKEDHGVAHASAVEHSEQIRIRTPGGSDSEWSREQVANVIERRLRSMFREIAHRLSKNCDPAMLGAGVVLTGGVAATPGISELAGQCLGVGTRIGVPGEGFRGMTDPLARAGFAAVAGLALHGADRFRLTGEGGTTRTSGLVTRVGAWLREFF